MFVAKLPKLRNYLPKKTTMLRMRKMVRELRAVAVAAAVAMTTKKMRTRRALNMMQAL
jgi:hypothetical protein